MSLLQNTSVEMGPDCSNIHLVTYWYSDSLMMSLNHRRCYDP
jgi:hypothetical protein